MAGAKGRGEAQRAAACRSGRDQRSAGKRAGPAERVRAIIDEPLRPRRARQLRRIPRRTPRPRMRLDPTLKPRRADDLEIRWGDDIDGDGCVDLVVAPFPEDPKIWYRNPAGADVRWATYLIAPALSASMEHPVYVDLYLESRRV